MDRRVDVKINGTHLSKDTNRAGVRGEANVTYLRITFDAGWKGYAKKVTFWDARGKHPVTIPLTADRLEDITSNIDTYLCPIPGEALTEGGLLTFIVDGYTDGKRQRSVSDNLEVIPAPLTEGSGDAQDPTPSEAERLQAQIDGILDVIAREVTGASAHAMNAAASEQAAEASEDNAADYAAQALSHAENAESYAKQARESADILASSAAQASASAVSAANAAASAGTSETNAVSAASQANSSAQQARASAQSAIANAESAEISEMNAADYARHAQESAVDALVSENAAAGHAAAAQALVESLKVEYIKNINPETTGYATLLEYMAARYNEHPVIFGYISGFSDLPSATSAGQGTINLCGGILTVQLEMPAWIYRRATNSLTSWSGAWRIIYDTGNGPQNGNGTLANGTDLSTMTGKNGWYTLDARYTYPNIVPGANGQWAVLEITDKSATLQVLNGFRYQVSNIQVNPVPWAMVYDSSNLTQLRDALKAIW